MIRRWWLSGAFAVSGALAIAGALLPWLTLYAGLYAYSGMVGLYGRLIAAAGTLAVAAALVAARTHGRWLSWCAVALGFALVGFASWIYAGLQEVLRRPDAVMAVARPGPGLPFVFAAGALLVAGGFYAAIPRKIVVFDHQRPRVRRYANRSAVRMVQRHDRS